MKQVAIETVLVKINDTLDTENLALKNYGIRFITADGARREMICRKATKDATKKTAGIQKRGAQFYNLKRNGVILLVDIEKNEPRAVKVAMIYAFRDHDSNFWYNVFH